MLGKLIKRLKKADGERWAARVGAFASRRRDLAVRGLLAAGLALVVLLVHREVFSFIVERKPFRVPEIRTAVAPPWSGGAGEEVVRIEGHGSIFDPGLVDRAGRAFEACAWVKKVTSVERVFPDQIRVRFEYRRPHLAVLKENGYVLVDAAGVRLPGVYASAPPCDRGTVLSGVPSRPAEPGRVWDDAALRAGLAVAELAHADPLLRKLGVQEVNVSNHAGRLDPRRSEITLLAGNGCQLAWGRADARFGDPGVEEKLDNLRGVLAAYPGLEGLKRVSVYHPGQRVIELAEPYAQTPGVRTAAPQQAPLPRRR